jgi:hypothetical protein
MEGRPRTKNDLPKVAPKIHHLVLPPEEYEQLLRRSQRQNGLQGVDGRGGHQFPQPRNRGRGGQRPPTPLCPASPSDEDDANFRVSSDGYYIITSPKAKPRGPSKGRPLPPIPARSLSGGPARIPSQFICRGKQPAFKPGQTTYSREASPASPGRSTYSANRGPFTFCLEVDGRTEGLWKTLDDLFMDGLKDYMSDSAFKDLKEAVALRRIKKKQENRTDLTTQFIRYCTDVIQKVVDDAKDRMPQVTKGDLAMCKRIVDEMERLAICTQIVIPQETYV